MYTYYDICMTNSGLKSLDREYERIKLSEIVDAKFARPLSLVVKGDLNNNFESEKAVY